MGVVAGDVHWEFLLAWALSPDGPVGWERNLLRTGSPAARLLSLRGARVALVSGPPGCFCDSLPLPAFVRYQGCGGDAPGGVKC